MPSLASSSARATAVKCVDSKNNAGVTMTNHSDCRLVISPATVIENEQKAAENCGWVFGRKRQAASQQLFLGAALITVSAWITIRTDRG